MKRVDKITLISEQYTTDEIGQKVKTEIGNSVICTVQSVTRNEWTAAQQQSLSPSYQCRVFFADYAGEKLAELYGKRYTIYRTYQDGDYVEVYLAEKVGELHGE